MSKDRSKAILKEIRALRHEVDLRFRRVEEALGIDGPRHSGSNESPSIAEVKVPSEAPSRKGAVQTGTQRTPPKSLSRERDVVVTISPLSDLGLVRVVEKTIADTEGVSSAALRELTAESAILDVRVQEGVSVISAMRRDLPVAFDVVESDDSSYTIALARPAGSEASGRAVE